MTQQHPGHSPHGPSQHGPSHGQGYGPGSGQHSPQQGPPHGQGYGPPPQENEGSGCGKKILFVLLGLGALSAVLCCVGGIFLYSKIDFEVTEDPAAATALTEEIAEIDIYPGFEPAGTLRMDVWVMEMNMAFYEYEEADGFFALAELDIIGSGDEDVAREMRQSMEDSGVDDGEDLRVISTETREFEIRGEASDFEFSELEHRETGEPYRQIAGAFPGKDKPFAAVWMLIHEDYYDDATAVAMIESIK